MNTFIKIFTKSSLIAAAILVLASCGPKEETKLIIASEAKAAGPFFAGPNSLIAEYEVDLSSLEGLEGVNSDDIKVVKINSIKVSLRSMDSLSFNSFYSASLQMVGANTGMQSIAIKNPIAAEGQEITLEVSEEVDLADYFKSDKFSMVLDLDFVDDSYADEIGAIIDLDLTVKHN